MPTKVAAAFVEGNATADDLATLRALFVGALMDFPHVPDDPAWIPCYGQTLNVADYPALAAKLGSTYGGDGVTTFGLPDERGRVGAGQDDMGGTSANRLTGQTNGVNGDVLGATGGAETHTLTGAEMPAHTHSGTTSSSGSHSHSVGDTARSSGNQDGGTVGAGSHNDATSSISGAHTHTFTTSSAGSGSAHNIVQPTSIHYRCILAY